MAIPARYSQHADLGKEEDSQRLARNMPEKDVVPIKRGYQSAELTISGERPHTRIVAILSVAELETLLLSGAQSDEW